MEEGGTSIRAIEFPKPWMVHLVNDKLGAADEAENTIVVETTYTAVSPGTELLAFKGQMPDDIPMDATIATQQSAFKYPCRYGYCAVGRVTDGQGTQGRRVFAFREHVSMFRQPAEDLVPIPDDVDDANAALMPAFETAVSLLADAALTPGDRVCVVGQGLIGLSVTAALRRLAPYSRVVTMEPSAVRRDLSVRAGGAHASVQDLSALRCALAGAGRDGSGVDRDRDRAGDGGGADVTIEVSGTAGGLDTAVAATRAYGRIVLGSWYGGRQMWLTRLGGAFHRSHVTLVASQVSEVHAALAPRWSKARRFALAWQLVRDVRPVETFGIAMVAPDDCAKAYKQMCKGDILAGVFDWKSA